VRQNSLSSDEDEGNSKNRFHHRDNEDEEDEEDEDDDANYFTSSAPSTSGPRSRKPQHRITDRSGYISSTTSPKHRLPIKNPSSLTDVLSQLWSTSGLTSMWKATNATFIYSLLLPTLNTFIRSLLSAVLGLPDDGTTSSVAMDILTAASPSTTLILTLVSSALSAILLSPIDTARTFLIATPLTHGPRSLLRAIRLLPTPRYRIPSHLVPITILHSSLPSLLNTGTPLFLKSYISIDPALNPSAWSLCTFLASGLELGIRFPLETVLRRAQIATFTAPALRQKSRGQVVTTAEIPEVETIVPTPRAYRGIMGTIWGIVYEEGVSPSPSDMERVHRLVGKPASRAQQPQQRRRQGQGIQGLYRGWRIGMWGLAGIWGADFFGAALGVGEEDFATASFSRSGIRTDKAQAF
jgi:mitochondrial fusion and transport protein UGO1